MNMKLDTILSLGGLAITAGIAYYGYNAAVEAGGLSGLLEDTIDRLMNGE